MKNREPPKSKGQFQKKIMKPQASKELTLVQTLRPADATVAELETAFMTGRVADTIDRLMNQSSRVETHAALMRFVKEARGLDRSLAVLAEAVALANTPATIIEAHAEVKRIENAVEGLVNVSRQKAVNEVASHGAVREEGKLGMSLTVDLPDGRQVEQRIDPLSTVPQAKRVEALLRAKGLDPKQHMTVEVSLSVDAYKLECLRQNGTITPDEYEATKPALVWKLVAPKVKEKS